MKAWVIVVLVIIAVGLVWGLKRPVTRDAVQAPADAILFKGASCGCCGVYVDYLQRKGYTLDIRNPADMDGVKAQYGVPSSMQSCHTTVIGGDFVEGHMPQEAITKLLAEKPDIKGIALPGMPMGAPGMPGAKNQPWIVYAVNNDGSTTEFMRI